MRNKILTTASIFGILVLLLNKIAMIWGWYNAIKWFDVPMHFLGGVFVALSIIGFLVTPLRKIQSTKKRVIIVLFLTLVVGLLWEWFEYFIVYRFLHGPMPGRGGDFFADLFFDVLGGGAAFVFVSFKKNKVQ